MSKKEKFYYTNLKTFTKDEAIKAFHGKLSDDNLEILIDHICIPDFAKDIEGFKEEHGVLILKAAGNFVPVTRRTDTDIDFSEEGKELVFNGETFYVNCEPPKEGIKTFNITRVCKDCGTPEYIGGIAALDKKANFYPYVEENPDHIQYLTSNEVLLVAEVMVNFEDYYKKYI